MTLTDHTRVRPVFLNAVGVALPHREVETPSLFSDAGEAERFVSLTGILSRRFAADEEATSDLAVRACQAALDARAALRPERLILSTMSPDFPSPGTSPLVLEKLGLGGLGCVDLAAACTGFAAAVDLAARFVATGDAAVLAAAAEVRSRQLRSARPGVRALFGDGAAAALVSQEAGPLRLLSSRFTSDGKGHGEVRVPAGGSREPVTVEAVQARRHVLQIEDGPHVYFRAVEGFAELARAHLESAGLTPADVAWVVPHQANTRILERAARLSGVDFERWVVTADRTGNVGGASAGLALAKLLSSRSLRAGERVLVVTAGAGLLGGSLLLEAQ